MNWKVKKILVKPYQSLSLQMHKYRTEHWIVLKGKAKVEINGKTSFLNENQSTYIPLESKHRLSNNTTEDLEVIEIQFGDILSEDDIRRYEDTYGDDWWWKMNEVHDKMLEKLGLDEGCSIDDDETPKQRMTMKEFALRNVWGEIDEAAEYNGRPVKLNNPTRGDVKKYKVYVRNDKGNVVKVEFGDPNMEIKRDDPARRKSFRARHNCDNPGPKYKARYWSCKFWSAKSVSDLMKG